MVTDLGFGVYGYDSHFHTPPRGDSTPTGSGRALVKEVREHLKRKAKLNPEVEYKQSCFWNNLSARYIICLLV